eukprot:UN21490
MFLCLKSTNGSSFITRTYQTSYETKRIARFWSFAVRLYHLKLIELTFDFHQNFLLFSLTGGGGVGFFWWWRRWGDSVKE